MKKSELRYDYPQELVALAPQRPSRVMQVTSQGPIELRVSDLIDQSATGDVWVINNTRVMPRRIWTLSGVEVLFLQAMDTELLMWQVLFPASRLDLGDQLLLPNGVTMILQQKGLPQLVQVNQPLSSHYFEKYGELPLPPYIQKLRDNRHQTPQDHEWYQTAWAELAGSLAAPTASLHFSLEDMQVLKNKGVLVLPITLHVGLGTFLPIQTEDLHHHQMHREWVQIDQETWDQIQTAKLNRRRIWAVGTTVTRALESVAKNKLTQFEGGYFGETDLFMYPGFKIEVVDRLLTNFHQPESTLLALVAAFQDLSTVKACYQWAIEHQFRLFSYGDLSVWDVQPSNN